MSRSLPLFPLGVVLFPGMVLPLHIFEPRYRQMLVDCASEDDRFGLCPPAEGRGAPDIGVIGCVAEILEKESLPDGRSNILVVGRERFRLMRLVDDGTPYWYGEVEAVEDLPGHAPTASDVQALRRYADRYVALIRLLTDEPIRFDLFDDDPAVFTWELASLLELSAQSRQRILASRAVDERVELLLRIMPQILPTLEDAVILRQRAADGEDPDDDATGFTGRADDADDRP
jgi:Lon protease-like protein